MHKHMHGNTQAVVFFAGEVCLGHAIVADTPR